ncbi:Pc12g04010 [Penicillium rubens Wisconsin 54-1255]|uniref:Pc12g04010 protein n=1 Tax=Penicillium rubens (strain ATCC 28089 / DSM 1075 / NRRL 1951 / Wisconsin 54-1255) TaxID=500485 RepID=B6GXA9_PENRW|nr:Pc12g04010 [Penicillium rubens Wisconsin 54-1255]
MIYPEDISYPFDFVEATRKDRPISSYVELYLAHYLKIGHRANLPLSGLAATISSALFIDHYVPEILTINPRIVFRTLYRSVVIIAYRSSKALWPNRPLVVDILPPTISPTILAIDGSGISHSAQVQVFDTALKSAFRECRRIFSATREDLPGPRRSGPKVTSTWPITQGMKTSKSYRRGSVISRSYALFQKRSLISKPRISAISFVTVSHYLDVPLGNTPYAINAIEAIEDYRDLIILYIDSSLSSTYCQKIPRLYSSIADYYVSDCGLIDRFRGLDSLCLLYRCYSRSVTFLARYLEYKSYDVIRNPVRGRRRGPDPYRNSRVKFARRSHTLKVKAYKLTKFYNTDIYVVVNHQRGSFVYNSVEDRSWPPNDKKLLLGRSYLHRLFTNLIKRNESFLKDQRLPSILQPAQLTIANMVTQSPSHPDTQVVGSTYEPFQSSYMRMIMKADGISWQDNVLASTAHWILLAGYLVIQCVPKPVQQPTLFD